MSNKVARTGRREAGALSSAPLPSDGNVLPPETPLEQLARILRDKMEHLDPTAAGDLRWGQLEERDRVFYRLCVKGLLLREHLIQAAIRQLANDDRIDRSPVVHEKLKLDQ